MATLNLIRHRFYNNDGTLASGGKVYTYAAGTSTPIATYTTAAATVANANPIILDAKGECDMWVTGVIKVNLLQSDNVQVTGYPVDNINYPSVAVWNDRGNFNASVNTFPTTGGSGVSGAIKAGDYWTISVEATGGPLDAYAAGTTVRALVDTPAQTAGNWAILDVGLGPSNAAAAASAAAAAASAANALTSENNAATSETNAGTSETNAALSEAAALAYAQAMSLNATQDTSASSVAIGTGAKTFTVTAGKSFVGGMFLVIADTAAPSTNSMYGQITSYSGTTLIVNVLSVLGSGIKTAWTISQTSAANLNVDTATNAGTSGTFTITGTGFTANPTATATWRLNNGVVSLYVPFNTITGTSNAITFTLTGLPAAIRPTSFQVLGIFNGVDNGFSIAITGNILAGTSTIQLDKTAYGGVFTESGTKGLESTTFTWTLD